MQPKDKKKNILDLKYQTYLSYLSIIVIVIITSFITVVLGTKDTWEIRNLISTGILVFLSVILIWLFFVDSFKNIREEINKL